MPNDVLAEEVNDAMRSASDILSAGRIDEAVAGSHTRRLEVIQQRLLAEVEERSGPYIAGLIDEKNKLLDAVRLKEKDKRIEDTVRNQSACHQTFESLRQVNNGAYPKNISPVIYMIPLLLVGVAEWYVNYATFAAHFVPVFAIAGTLLVAVIFAWASHLHGEYLKQLSEMLHPSLEYRHKIDRQLIVAIATVLLAVAFGVVIWLRYELIAEQLGVSKGSSGAFGGPSTDMVWSKVAPTIIMNLFIWGIGTLYSWAMHERVPNLRESYRALLAANRRLEKARKPLVAEETQIKAKHEVDMKKNQVAIKEYRTLADSVQDMLQRFGAPAQPQPKDSNNVRKVR